MLICIIHNMSYESKQCVTKWRGVCWFVQFKTHINEKYCNCYGFFFFFTNVLFSQVYVIQVKVGDHSWTVKHRYSDFHDLHEKVSYADTFLK